MIGIFDSGSGGLTFYHEVKKRLPEYNYIYFGDYKNCPYGNRSTEEIFALTKQGVEKLRDAGAKIVILACNTAVANAIRALQKDEKNLGVKVLGVTIPGAEKVVESGYKNICVVATCASVRQKVYRERVHILDNSVKIREIGLANLAIMVENFLDKKISRDEIKQYLLEEIADLDEKTEAIILGCTHYSHISDIFAELFPEQKIIDPSFESAKKFEEYLARHPEIEKTLSKEGKFVDISER